MGITPTSKNKDAAFDVIETITSNEVQMDMSRHGRFPVMKDPKFSNAFGADLDFMKGNNIAAISKIKLSPSFIPTKYDSIAMKAVNDALANIVNNGIDVNTALQQAEDSVNKQISDMESAGTK